MRIVSLALFAAVLMPMAASAEEKKPQDPNRKICQSETPTGSYFAKRVCHTKAEWEALANAQSHGVDSMRQAGLAQPGAAQPR